MVNKFSKFYEQLKKVARIENYMNILFEEYKTLQMVFNLVINSFNKI